MTPKNSSVPGSQDAKQAVRGHFVPRHRPRGELGAVGRGERCDAAPRREGRRRRGGVGRRVGGGGELGAAGGRRRRRRLLPGETPQLTASERERERHQICRQGTWERE